MLQYWSIFQKPSLKNEIVDSFSFLDIKHWKEKLPFNGPNLTTVIAYEDATGQSAGFFLSEYDQEKEKDMVYVDHLHVLPGLQGSGIGKKLLQTACDWTRFKGLSKIYLYMLVQMRRQYSFMKAGAGFTT